MRKRIVLVLLGSAQLAYADVPLAMKVGLGVGRQLRNPTPAAEMVTPREAVGPTMIVELGVHVHKAVAIGVHTSGHRGEGTYRTCMISTVNCHEFNETFNAVQAGVLAQLAVHDRIWVAPWIGVQQRYALEQSDGDAAYGFGVGLDVNHERPHRTALQMNVVATPDTAYVSLGAAYRYW